MRHAKVCDAVTEEGWSIRGHRSCRFHDLHNSIMAAEPPKLEKGSDICLWKHGDDDYRSTFSSTRTWDQLRVKRSKVEQSKVVWFVQGVPSYSFITWLAIRNRLSTGDRMRQCGMLHGCEVCTERDETRDHLFFACPYSYTIQERLARQLVGNLIIRTGNGQ